MTTARCTHRTCMPGVQAWCAVAKDFRDAAGNHACGRLQNRRHATRREAYESDCRAANGTSLARRSLRARCLLPLMSLGHVCRLHCSAMKSKHVVQDICALCFARKHASAECSSPAQGTHYASLA